MRSMIQKFKDSLPYVPLKEKTQLDLLIEIVLNQEARIRELETRLNKS